jgi:hypothetical protein
MTKSFSVERNYRISNDDPYLKARFSQEVIPDENETTEDAALRAIKQLDNIFRIAYPYVAEHLNFHVERQVNGYGKGDLPLPKDYVDVSKIKIELPIEQKSIIEEPYDIIKEINSCKSATVLKIYEKQCKTSEQKRAYKNKESELSKNHLPQT